MGGNLGRGFVIWEGIGGVIVWFRASTVYPNEDAKEIVRERSAGFVVEDHGMLRSYSIFTEKLSRDCAHARGRWVGRQWPGLAGVAGPSCWNRAPNRSK